MTVLATAGAAACGGSRPALVERPEPVAAARSAVATFLTIHIDSPSSRYTVQLRDSGNGRLIRDLFTSAADATLSASTATAGSVLVSETVGCHATLDYLDPATAKTVASRHVADSVNDIAVSPNGHYLAYLTYPDCAKPGGIPNACSACDAFAPNVLVILDLRTGTSVRTASPEPGLPLDGVSWSPDGRRLLVGYTGYYEQLMILDAAHPDYRLAYRVPAPKDCGYLSGTWTISGIAAAEDCGGVPGLSPRHLVRISPTGEQLSITAIPRCIDGFSTETDANKSSLVIETNIGYGKKSCGHQFDARVSRVVGNALHTLINVAPPAGSIELT